ncbi:hypothetical protein WICPIJ_000255 [Wickerhamomyces pijperi]|uniref:Uncharacterized protein n=1 Tax=Wickerhamomyces pijperi TaxID=599730 RepID=A0A9P8QD51_WICPI|nr:hypothetical protein WICPIJ_000255 [Wickerhamomyces pijperi]
MSFLKIWIVEMTILMNSSMVLWISDRFSFFSRASTKWSIIVLELYRLETTSTMICLSVQKELSFFSIDWNSESENNNFLEISMILNCLKSNLVSGKADSLLK